MNELKRQDSFINENELHWNRSSKLSIYWLGFISKSPDKLTYYTYRDLYKKNPEIYEKDYEVIKRDIDEGRTDINVWNYSMRNFLHRLINEIPVKEFRENMKHVLEALMVKFPQIGYCQGMNYIIGFLLCFANEGEAFELFSDLIERVLPSRFFQRSEKGDGLLGVLAETHVLKKLMQDANLFQMAENYEKAKEFIDLKAPHWLLSLLVNVLDFEGTFHIFNMMFEWGYFSFLEKAILLIIQRKFEEYKNFGNDSLRINDSITRDINNVILQKISDIPVDEKMRNESYLEYLKQFAEKWNKSDKMIHRQLSKITYFTKEEIQQLQKEYNFLVESQKKHHSKKFDKKEKKISNNEEEFKIGEIDIITHEASCKELNSNEGKTMEKKEKKSHNRLTEKKHTKKIKGITKDDFLVIMQLMNKQDNNELKSEDLDRIFDIFDDDKSGTLDFREFLCCMSLLMRGTIKEKLEMCFNVYDKDNKGYLLNEEAIKMIEGEQYEFNSNQELFEFQYRLSEIIQRKDKVTLLDFASVENDPFVKEVTRRNMKKKEKELVESTESNF